MHDYTTATSLVSRGPKIHKILQSKKQQQVCIVALPLLPDTTYLLARTVGVGLWAKLLSPFSRTPTALLTDYLPAQKVGGRQVKWDGDL